MKTPQVGDRVYLLDNRNTVLRYMAERRVSPITGNPAYRVVEKPADVMEANTGRWIGVEEVYGIFPAAV